MVSGSADYGPFAPVVGYAGAIMATGGAVFVMWGGKMKKWRPPDEDLPGTAQSFVLLLCGLFMVVEWYFAEPSFVARMIAAVVVLAIVAVACFLRYSDLIGSHTYFKKVVKEGGKIEDERILGGRHLTAGAEKARAENNVDVQTLFAGAAYNPDLIWERSDRQSVKSQVLLFFIFTLVLATSALTTASFATQVMLTRKAAASVIKNADAPGLK